MGSPISGATPPTSGTAGQPIVGVIDAYTGQPGFPYPGQQAGGLVVGPAGGYGYEGVLGGAGAIAPAPGQVGVLAARSGGGFRYGGALGGAGVPGVCA